MTFEDDPGQRRRETDDTSPKDIPTPNSLAEGQDFYAQPPFDDKIAQLAAQQPYSEHQIKQVMSRFFGNIDVITALKKDPSAEALDRVLAVQVPFEISPRSKDTWMVHIGKYLHTSRSDRIKNTIVAIQEAFQDIEEWQTYINAGRDTRLYFEDGQFNPKGLDKGEIYRPTTSYTAWIREWKSHEPNLKNVGIHEAVRSAFASTSDVFRAAGRGAGWQGGINNLPSGKDIIIKRDKGKPQ